MRSGNTAFYKCLNPDCPSIAGVELRFRWYETVIQDARLKVPKCKQCGQEMDRHYPQHQEEEENG